ncbi:acylneuraminate cytidylyltransferase [Fibrisoma montanum]|uniref:Acylneuraminate cytidylyltransferase n=1 Tax=Fibrisoma montanum TaxID=2305895 RepID=A0A418M4L6_9BACT|nr:glycosyltransferase family protein [Fibrisoma montanum]RIV20766.1 acylneuraminate cytidylyltransferase [Fibrisoma montanum]
MSNLTIVVIVQARMLSSRLPGKVMLPLLGKPLLYRMIERIQQAELPFTTVVATSTDPTDDVIARFCEQEGIAHYRGSLTNLLDRHYQIAGRWNADVAVKIPSDCPLIDPRAIDQVLRFFLAHPTDYDFVSNLHPATWPDGNDVEVMTRACLHTAWEKSTKPLELEHTTPYIWDTAPDQFRRANVTWPTGLDYSMSHRFTIDYPDDYEFIRAVYEALYPANPRFSCDDILALLAQRPELYAINARYAGVNWYRHHLDELNTVTETQTRHESDNPIYAAQNH